MLVLIHVNDRGLFTNCFDDSEFIKQIKLFDHLSSLSSLEGKIDITIFSNPLVIRVRNIRCYELLPLLMLISKRSIGFFNEGIVWDISSRDLLKYRKFNVKKITCV